MNTKKITFSAAIISISILLPFIFHLTGTTLGPMLLPIHYGAYLAGLFLGPLSGVLVGLITPFISHHLANGMPPIVFVPFMTFELIVYGIVSGYLFYKKKMNIILSLIIAMILGRLALISSVYFIGHLLLGLEHKMLEMNNIIIGAFITGLPGMLIQLILIPIIVQRVNVVFRFNER